MCLARVLDESPHSIKQNGSDGPEIPNTESAPFAPGLPASGVELQKEAGKRSISEKLGRSQLVFRQTPAHHPTKLLPLGAKLRFDSGIYFCQLGLRIQKEERSPTCLADKARDRCLFTCSKRSKLLLKES